MSLTVPPNHTLKARYEPKAADSFFGGGWVDPGRNARRAVLIGSEVQPNAVLIEALAVLVHAHVAIPAADDQVVQDLDAQHLAGRHQVFGDSDVVIAGRWVS